jgi:hypothetical protein
MTNLAEVAEKQDAIIKTQSEVINELFLLLLKYISAEDADMLPVLNKINTAAQLKEEYDFIS